MRDFQKDGPKRRRHTRRDTPEGGYSQYPRDFHPRLMRDQRVARAVARAERRSERV